jgi:serine/threonine protein kinase
VTAGRAPQPFGKYLLLERIGAGGMAEVFRTIATGPEGFQRSLVIKRILPHLSQDASFVRMFIDEAKLSGLLSHPNLVQIFEFGKVEESFFIAMEYVHGRTLSALQDKLGETGRLAPVAASVEIARQICVGLHYAHALHSNDGRPLGIVHRDISPSNLMLGFHGGVKILDFGIARVAEGLRQSRTQVGSVKGKISYMAPEQIRLEEIDSRSDIFALGIVLHEMLTGRRLFRSNSDYGASRLVLELPIPLPSTQNPEVPAVLDSVVMRALDRNRDARYATAGDVARDLELVMLEMRVSPHEHTKLLKELFASEVSQASDVGISEAMLSSTTAMHSSHEKVTSPISRSTGMVEPSFAVELGSYGSADRLRQRVWRAPRRWIIALAALLALALAAVPIVLRSRRPAEPAPVAAPSPVGVTVVAAPSPAPAVAPVRLSLDSNPQDAQVTRMDTGQSFGQTPLTIALPRSTEVIAFRFDKPGYAPEIHKIIPDLDRAVSVDLLEVAAVKPAGPARVPAAGPARAPRAKEGARADLTPKTAGRPAPASAPTPVSTVADCSLSVGAFPWAELWVDGRDTGQHTPVVHLPIGCGAHKLSFKRHDLGIDHAVDVNLTAGHELKQTYQLKSMDFDD